MTKFTLKSVSGERGFTLVELLVYIAIVGVVLGAIYTMFYRQQDSYLVQDRLALLQQNLRGAMAVLANDIQMAGHYTCYEQRPLIILGKSRPILEGNGSSITLFKVDAEAMRPLDIGVLGNPADDEFAEAGYKTITVDNTLLNVNNRSLNFDTTTNKYGVLIKADLSRAEFFQVTGGGGGILTVLPIADNDPYNPDPDPRLVESYFAGATPEQSDLIAPVEVITYSRDGNDRLWRSGEMVAEHITGLQLSYAVVDDFVGEDWVGLSKQEHPSPGEKADNQPWDARDVRRVTVTLSGDIKVSDKLGNKQRTLSSTIKVRNLGMDMM